MTARTLHIVLVNFSQLYFEACLQHLPFARVWVDTNSVEVDDKE
jgi:hypothetical protein